MLSNSKLSNVRNHRMNTSVKCRRVDTRPNEKEYTMLFSLSVLLRNDTFSNFMLRLLSFSSFEVLVCVHIIRAKELVGIISHFEDLTFSYYSLCVTNLDNLWY